ncbi:hypothetical protein I6A84_21280 [Frankia sp. CNm7]|uniref:Arsenate reductase n=1 Tax=Frankia nepalensis TaxID=1836974 RepID=A0A937R8A4_9ACTN|nr:hypothetical protein [Frankia nepalensis]MBL7502427.1 hypothetical protein [Frankia nepalensis]MBL7516273.1 hypothetical protein [Frankia nepalensis]MBL7520550.1 hypothetical protein [Frankia nepalensis]MBL7625730.1 hypothetical protein [Frankia nepalensis]
MPFAKDVPRVDACSLPSAAQPLRIAEFDALFANALHRLERVDARHLRLTLTGGDGLEETTRDLTARESQCCSFFTFTITPTGDHIVLDIEVPTAQTAVLDGLATLATDAAPTAGR